MTPKRTSLWKRLFFWLSGAGTETLEKCPNWEQRKYVAFGATVLVPSVFAFIACAYALSTLTDNNYVIYPVAGVWSFIILTIDRALLSTYRAFLSPFKKLGQFMLRFVVAGLMGVTIAHPMVLLLFKDTITGVIEQSRMEEIKDARAYFTEQKSAELNNIKNHEDAITRQQDRWNKSFSAKFIVQEQAKQGLPDGMTLKEQQELKAKIEEATGSFKLRVDEITEEVATLTVQYTRIQQEQAHWQEQFEQEVNGERSGFKGLGPRARSIRDDQLVWRRDEASRLGELLKSLSMEKSALLISISDAEKSAILAQETKMEARRVKAAEEESRVAALHQQVQADQADQFVTQQNALRSTIKGQLDSMLSELDRKQEALAAVTKDERSTIQAISDEPRQDILTQTLALHKLFRNGEEGGNFAFTAYWILTALFMLVDTIPLMVKFFTKAGPYDKLLEREEVEFDSEYRSFLKNHERYVEQLQEGNLVAVTRNKSLEGAMQEGVEHTRAARAFLDSMVELERSFSEKMQLEEQDLVNPSPEKLAAIEAIKKGFYDNLHQRMEQYFAQPTELREEKAS